MMEIKIYEPKKEPCEICKANDSIYLPICEIEGKCRMFAVCKECRDKVPYKVIPVVTKMDKGYYYFNDKWRRGK